MKVICIDGEFRNWFGELATSGVPKEGDIDTVIEECDRTTNRGIRQKAYRLERFSNRTFHAAQFAHISEIDETEMIREYKKQLV